MVKISLILINGRDFDFCLEYGAVLKLVSSIYPFYELTQYRELVTGFTSINTLKNKKKIDIMIKY